MVRAQSTCPMRKSWGNWAGSAYGRDNFRGTRETEPGSWLRCMHDNKGWHKLKQRRFLVDGRLKKTSLWGGLSRTGCPEKLCSPHPCRFQDLTGQSPEQPCLISELTLLWAGGWTRDLHWGSFQLEQFCDPEEVNLCSRAPRLSKVSAKNTWWSQMTKSNSSSYWQCESLQVSYGLLLTPNRDELKIHCNQTGIFIWETLTLEICQTSDEILAVLFLKRKGEQDLANSQLLTKEIVKKMSLCTCRLH